MSEERKPRISPSLLGTLSRCGMQAYFGYVKKIRQPPGVAMLTGRAAHDTIQDDLSHKIETKTLLTSEEIADNAAAYLRSEWDKEAVALDPDERAQGRKKVLGYQTDRAVRLALLHHTEVAPKMKPLTVEERFDIRVADCSHDISGKLDVKQGGGKAKPWREIDDTKTKGKAPPKGEVYGDVQLQLYALAVKVKEGIAPRRIGRTYLVGTKTTTKLVEERGPAPKDYTPVLRRVHAAAAMLDAGTFYPCAPSDWVCQAKFCGYWESTCPFGRRARTLVPVD